MPTERVLTVEELMAAEPPCLKGHEECTTCQGHGLVQGEDCRDCHAQGWRLCPACEAYMAKFGHALEQPGMGWEWLRRWIFAPKPKARRPHGA